MTAVTFISKFTSREVEETARLTPLVGLGRRCCVLGVTALGGSCSRIGVTALSRVVRGSNLRTVVLLAREIKMTFGKVADKLGRSIKIAPIALELHGLFANGHEAFVCFVRVSVRQDLVLGKEGLQVLYGPDLFVPHVSEADTVELLDPRHFARTACHV